MFRLFELLIKLDVEKTKYVQTATYMYVYTCLSFQSISYNCIVLFSVLQGITQLILATDMARHSEIIENFKSKLDGNFDFKNKEQLDTVSMSQYIHFDAAISVRIKRWPTVKPVYRPPPTIKQSKWALWTGGLYSKVENKSN